MKFQCYIEEADGKKSFENAMQMMLYCVRQKKWAGEFFLNDWADLKFKYSISDCRVVTHNAVRHQKVKNIYPHALFLTHTQPVLEAINAVVKLMLCWALAKKLNDEKIFKLLTSKGLTEKLATEKTVSLIAVENILFNIRNKLAPPKLFFFSLANRKNPQQETEQELKNKNVQAIIYNQLKNCDIQANLKSRRQILLFLKQVDLEIAKRSHQNEMLPSSIHSTSIRNHATISKSWDGNVRVMIRICKAMTWMFGILFIAALSACADVAMTGGAGGVQSA